MAKPAADAAEAAAAAPEISAQERLFGHCELGQYEEIAALMRSGRRNLFVNCVNSRGDTPLHVVRDVRCAELLLDSGGSQAALNRQNGDGETPLMASLRLGNAGLASLYLDNGADIRSPNRHFQSCLHAAARSGMAEALDRLLAMRQLDPNQRDRMGNAALHYAVALADAELACGLLDRLLQESQLAVDAEDALGRTAFALAAQSGNLAACRLLRDRGCDLCHADAHGANALHLSAAVSGPETVRYLVSDLAFSVDFADKVGRTALFCAAHHAAEASLAELLALGADPNRTDRLGRSPVHVAAEKGHDACLARLLAAGAQPWLADVGGQTPLHLAAANGHREVVKRLLRCDRAADFLESRDAAGMTAGDLAGRQPQQQPVVELLAQAVKARNQRQQKRRSYPRPRSGAAKAREEEVASSKKRPDREGGKDNGEPMAYPRPVSAVAKTRSAEKEKKKVTEEKQQLEEIKAVEEAEKKAAEAEKAVEDAEKADEFPSDEEQSAVYPKDETTQQVRPPKQDSDGTEKSQRQANEAENTEEGIDSNKKIDVAEAQVDGTSEGPPQLELTSSSMLSTSSSSLKRTSVVIGDAAASGGGSSRPSSHLDEELHGDRRAREAEDRRHDPYLTAKPEWITGVPSKSKTTTQQQPRLRRGKMESPNIAALRQRLYMYDSTALLGRVLNEERRERMLLRGGAHLPLARLQLQPPRSQQPPQAQRPRRRRHPSRPSTAADAERLSGRYRDINQETRQLLDKWKLENDSYGAVGSRPVSGRDSSHTRSPSGDRSGGAVAADATEGRGRGRSERPYRRPQSGSRFLDYFPNNRPGAAGGANGETGSGGDKAAGEGRRRGRPKSSTKLRVKSRAN